MSIQSVPVVVPVSGDGAVADVSSLVGQKTVVLSGRFGGYYDLLGSHDDASFVGVLSFNAGGIEGIRQTVSGSFKSFRLRSNATQVTPVSCEVSGVVGQNLFAVVASLPVGSGGETLPVDTYALFPPTGLESDVCFICTGGFRGSVVIMGSIDGASYNPVGSFKVDRLPEGSTEALTFPVLTTSDKVRYVKLSLSGLVTSPLTVTMGGNTAPSAGGEAGVAPAGSSEGRETTIGAADEEVLYEQPVDLDVAAPGTSFVPRFSLEGLATAAVSPSAATFRAYLGSTTPGSTVGGTVRATLSTPSPARVLVGVTGASFASPGGRVLLQVTGRSSVPATEVARVFCFSFQLTT